jgi:hypothetical protein
MSEPVRVNAPGLRMLGGELAGHGAELKRNTDAVKGQLVPEAGPGVSGWASFAALGVAGSGWGDYSTGLGGRIEATGQRLIEAANNYQGTDDRSGERHVRVGRRMGNR